MSKLIPLYVICFGLAIISDMTSVYDYRKERYIYKEKMFFILLSVATILFAGVRTAYNDTSAYIEGYELLTIDNGLLSSVEWSLGDYPAFTLLSCSMKALGLSSQSFVMLFAALTIGLQLWFVRKYTNNIALSVYLFFTMGCFGFSMAAMKQCAAIALCMIAIDRQINKKYVEFVFLVILATLFHPFALMFLVSPLLEFRPWGKKTVVLFVVAIAAALSMQYWLGNLVDFMSLMGKDYDETALVGEGVNLFRLAVMWSPVILSYFTMNYWDKKKDDKVQNLMINLMILNAVLMFVALFGNPIYFGRLANYFLIFQVIGLTYLLQYFTKDSRILLIIVIVGAYFAYSYYGNVMSGVSFDQSYEAVPILQYLSSII